MNNDSEFIEHAYSLMSDQQILLAYLGDVTPELINAILKGVKNDSVGFQKEELLTKKKVYNIIVESLENITRHSEVEEKGLQPSLFLLGKNDKNYFVVSGNYIYNNQVDNLKQMIDQVNALDKENIKKVYRDILAEGKISVKGGAGLGIIDMAIKSGNKLEYTFIPVQDKISFYILKTQVSSVV
ncbi:MAG: hypothetical protein HYU69_01445 [Bacteroidetes bacterium]|nr:hypothetical protein [Bacteroidota bacterium]